MTASPILSYGQVSVSRISPPLQRNGFCLYSMNVRHPLGTLPTDMVTDAIKLQWEAKGDLADGV